MTLQTARSLGLRFACMLSFLAMPAGFVAGQDEFYIELRSGLRFGPGISWSTDSISTDAFQQGGTTGPNKGIGVLEDGLRRTYYNTSPRNLLNVQKSNAPKHTQLELASADERARTGAAPAIFGIMGISNFNKFGRRTYSFMTSRGQVDVVQGITLLTPQYAKVEVLRAEPDSFVWDQRVAISSIPADQLRQILYQALDLTQANEWLRLTGFYLEAERFSDARDTVAEALRRFPTELADRVGLLEQTEQFLANQLFEEIKLRRNAGQHELAKQLSVFPSQSLPLETQVRLTQEIETLKEQIRRISEVTAAFRECVSKLPEPDQQVVAPVADEIFNEIRFDTEARLADFQRLRSDASIPNENLVGLAIGGWLLGVDAGIQNFAVAKSLIRVRGLVRAYLDEASQPRREEILRELQSEEGAQPALLAKLLATMKPPKDLPPQDEGDPPGFYRASATLASGETVNYVVQLPPEYDPNRKYPCVLALPGKTEPPEIEIEFWCGINVKAPQGEFRTGQATRHGYIVVAPDWMLDKQPEYQYTEGEKARILAAFRDALRRTSIDTDRVFISGHFDGATAAWDIAQSHPDLWAGAVMISPGADKFIAHYYENLRALNKSPDEIPLATYIVFGQMDGTRFDSKLGSVATRYLEHPTYDSVAVEYIGRGRERFLAELPRIVEWMELSSHRRIRTPSDIHTVTMRPGDRLFYWLEAPQILPAATSNAFQFDASKSAKFEASVLDSTINGVRISSIPSANRDAVVWLTPSMVDFSRPITIMLRGDRSRYDLTPDIGVMLEDARRRADRMHVYWQRVAVP